MRRMKGRIAVEQGVAAHPTAVVLERSPADRRQIHVKSLDRISISTARPVFAPMGPNRPNRDRGLLLNPTN